MMKKMVVTGVMAVVSVLVVGAASANTVDEETATTEACAIDSKGESAVVLSARPPIAQRPGTVLATPQCNYLQKCCEGNTPNAPKCCEGYFKKCGGGPNQ